jgi:hypothetical protein
MGLLYLDVWGFGKFGVRALNLTVGIELIYLVIHEVLQHLSIFLLLCFPFQWVSSIKSRIKFKLTDDEFTN